MASCVDKEVFREENNDKNDLRDLVKNVEVNGESQIIEHAFLPLNRMEIKGRWEANKKVVERKAQIFVGG